MEEKKEKKEKTPMDKAKKKKIIKRSIVGAVAVLLVFMIVSNAIAARNMSLMVETVAVTRDDVEQVLSTSGTVKSEEIKTYFSKVAVEVGQINAAPGDSVKKGDVLFSYDETALADEKQMAELKIQATEGGYESSMSKDNQYIRELGEANINLDVLKQQIEDSENYVATLNQKIKDKQNALAYEGTLLQISLLDWQDQPYSEEYMNLQKQIQYNTYEQQHNKEIAAWQKEVEEYQDKIAAYKEYQAEMKSQKSASEGAAMDSGGKNQLLANTQMEKITATETLQSIEEVEKGVIADFDGVVTEFSVVEGSIPAVGTQMITLESTEKVKVDISVSKYDLEKIAVGQEVEITIAGKAYEGTVSKINGMATINNSGAAVVGAEIAIDNPDSSIFLGVEAKVKIHTASAEQVLIVPVEVINSDKDGEFVYVVENGVLVKRQVVTGISSDISCEIKEGLNEGEQIVSNVSANLEEGMPVTAIPSE
ncbi:MAG: efflux RND transporter periplasmic adaptor subunit [Blautia sp.]|nr:efflux RND transporter periplasmic adaptor subunit [Lachnoclostridium sp.]MCM1210329.1 efflux RND transporter periplasmic adaptor subunit [Blautia sp.]